jgi:hypothetical protein
VVILDLLDGVAFRILGADPALKTELAAPAVAGEDLDAVEGGHDAALHAALVQRLVPLQPAIDVHQHLFERIEGEAAQAIAQRVVAEGPLGADPDAELALGQIRLQLLEAGEAEQECMEQRQEDGLRGDLRIVAGIAEATGGLAEGEDFIDVGGEGRQGVGGVAFHSIKCKIIQKPNSLLPSPL